MLFLLEAEKAHEVGLKALQKAGNSPFWKQELRRRYAVEDERLRRPLFGLDFPNPLGIAAGLDKNAEAYAGLGALGAGFVEIGTVTPRPQSGNPRPRLFRLKRDRAILNRMGFNNDGSEAIAERLRERSGDLLIGANLGKNRDTPNEEATRDYERCLEEVHPFVDYLVVNLSSPNTPGLRELQREEVLRGLLDSILDRRAGFPDPKPLLLKISPDLDKRTVDDILGLVMEKGVDGLIATNTSMDRQGLRTPPKIFEPYGKGGISGNPIRSRSNEIIRHLKEGTDGEVPVVGVGGVLTEQDALAKLDAGADLLQVYTGLIYEGPALMKRILRAILARQEAFEKEKNP
ncbi:MAG: quinone-dependent dihydroorotate dehydrogenase [Flavobacteriales bacterium]